MLLLRAATMRRRPFLALRMLHGRQSRCLHGRAVLGRVPFHNAAAFVCMEPLHGDTVDCAFSDAVASYTSTNAAGTTSVEWRFSTARCECPPGCDAGDILLFPHYLHLRPVGSPSATMLLDSIAHLELLDPGGTDSSEPTWTAEEGLEVVRSVRHNTFAFAWGEQAAKLQHELCAALEADADSKEDTPAIVVRCSPPFVTGAGEPDTASAGVCVFTAQTRDYATWGPGVGEWFAGLEDCATLAHRVSGWLGLSRRMGGGPQAMNTLGSAMAGCWRGRMGLENEMAAAVYAHYTNGAS